VSRHPSIPRAGPPITSETPAASFADSRWMSANAILRWAPSHAHTVSLLRDTANSSQPSPAARPANGLARPRAHRDQAEMLGVELVVDIGGVDGRAGEKPLHTLVAPQLGRVGHALGLILILARYRRREVVEQAPERSQHVTQSDPVAREVAVLGLLHDEVLEQRVARVVAQQHPLEAHAVGRRAPRLGDGRRRDRRRARSEPLLALLDGHEAVVDRLGDRGARAGYVLEVLAGRRIEADIAEAGDDRLLELQSAVPAGVRPARRGRRPGTQPSPALPARLGRGRAPSRGSSRERLRARLL
jgi:hypothetical protein